MTEPPPDDPQPSHEAERLVLELGRALHATGRSAHQVELIHERISTRLGLSGQFNLTLSPERAP